MNVREQLQNHLEQHRIAQKAAAKGIGISPTAINLYLNGTYKGSTEEVERKVAAWLQQQREKAEVSKLDIPFVETKTAKRTLGFLGLTNTLGQLGIIYGGAGLGKTTCLKEFAARYPAAILIEPDMGYTAKVLLQEICRKLGQSDKGNIHDLTERIADTLRGSGRLLMIDEAELLPLRALESLRRIHDKADTAVALVGMPRLLLNLKGPNAEFKQLFSRVSVKLDLGNESSEADLKEIAAQVLSVDDPAVLSKLVATAKGNIRKLSKLMMIVRHLMQVNRRDSVDAELIEHADGYLIH